MAVRHGYGKIAGADALVFAYDTGDTVNSYKGEPTENIFLNPTFIGTSGTQTSTVTDNWDFSGYTGDTGFKFHDNSSSPIPLKFPNEGAVITIGASDNSQNRRFYCSEVLEPGQTYTVSAWIYVTYSAGVNIAHFEYGGANLNTGYFPSTGTHPNHVVGEWYYWEGTYTVGADYTNGLIGPVFNGDADHPLAIQRFQIEKKSHATPFVNGTRSATEGLKDLTGNTSIDLTNAGFDSNAQIDLDGTGDYFETTTENQLTSDQTLEAVFIKDLDSAPHTTILCTDTAYENGIKLMAYKNSARYGLWLGFGSGGDVYNAFVNTALPNNEHLHLVGTWEQSTGIVKIYLNGELTGNISTGRTDDIQTRSGGRITIGADYHSLNNPYGTYAQVPIAKIYNRALTAGEIKNNYSHYKNRFGI